MEETEKLVAKYWPKQNKSMVCPAFRDIVQVCHHAKYCEQAIKGLCDSITDVFNKGMVYNTAWDRMAEIIEDRKIEASSNKM